MAKCIQNILRRAREKSRVKTLLTSVLARIYDIRFFGAEFIPYTFDSTEVL